MTRLEFVSAPPVMQLKAERSPRRTICQTIQMIDASLAATTNVHGLIKRTNDVVDLAAISFPSRPILTRLIVLPLWDDSRSDRHALEQPFQFPSNPDACDFAKSVTSLADAGKLVSGVAFVELAESIIQNTRVSNVNSIRHSLSPELAQQLDAHEAPIRTN